MADQFKTANLTAKDFPSLKPQEVGYLADNQRVLYKAFNNGIALNNIKHNKLDFEIVGTGGTVTYEYPVKNLVSATPYTALVVKYNRKDSGAPVLGASGWQLLGDKLVISLASTPAGVTCAVRVLVLYEA
jgi:hypothetical protein